MWIVIVKTPSRLVLANVAQGDNGVNFKTPQLRNVLALLAPAEDAEVIRTTENAHTLAIGFIAYAGVVLGMLCGESKGDAERRINFVLDSALDRLALQPSHEKPSGTLLPDFRPAPKDKGQ
jgi:hypothetical protein